MTGVNDDATAAAKDRSAEAPAPSSPSARGGLVEATTGFALILALLTPLLLLVLGEDGAAKPGQRIVVAQFANLGGLTPGSLIRIGGVDVGRVRAVTIDPQSLQAEVVLAIDERYSIPKDSAVYIGSDGVFGGSFVGILPGAATIALGPRERIERVENVRTLEDSVADVAFSSGLK